MAGHSGSLLSPDRTPGGAMHRRGRLAYALARVLLGCLALGATQASAQAAAPDTSTAPVRVYLDCQGQANFGCDQNFFRTEILFVDWVTDRDAADVHLLVTAQQAGGGGRQYTIAFLGLRRFADDNVQLAYASSGDATQDNLRRALSDQFKVGLVRYAAHTSVRDRLRVTYTVPAARPGGAAAAQRARDPWNFWVFNLSVNGFANGQTSSSSINMFGNANANRVTDAWKLSLGGNYNRNRDRYQLSDREVIAIRKNWGANGLAVKSLTTHWSTGVRLTAGSQSTSNQDLALAVATGVEYDVFPYSESTRRLFTFQYLFTATHFDWTEITLFNQMSETHPGQSIVANVQTNQPWGNIRMNLSLNQFLHDTGKYNVQIGGNGQWRIFRGFSINGGGNYTRVRDQLFLPRGTLTDDQILTQQQQLATGYRYFFNFGINYRFGSVNNNVVNPRFGPDFFGGVFFGG
jgi:hypothetical protein